MLEIVKSPANCVRPSVPATAPRSRVTVALPAPVVKPVRVMLGATGEKASGVPSVSNTISPLPTALPEEVAPPSSVGSRSEEHTSELQSLMRISYAVFCLKKKTNKKHKKHRDTI